MNAFGDHHNLVFRFSASCLSSSKTIHTYYRSLFFFVLQCRAGHKGPQQNANDLHGTHFCNHWTFGRLLIIQSWISVVWDIVFG